MKDGNIYILDLDFEYKLWKNKLIFYKSEVELLIDRIYVLEREKEGYEIDEGNLNQLKAQLESIDMLYKKITTMEQEMSFYAEDYPIDRRHLHYETHELIREDVQDIDDVQKTIMAEIYPGLCYPLNINEGGK